MKEKESFTFRRPVNGVFLMCMLPTLNRMRMRRDVEIPWGCRVTARNESICVELYASISFADQFPGPGRPGKELLQ